MKRADFLIISEEKLVVEKPHLSIHFSEVFMEDLGGEETIQL